MSRGLVRSLVGVCLCVLSSACQREGAQQSGLRLVGFQQAQGSDVLLNEPLVFHFSSELDPASVTPSSARVLDELGRLAAGDFRVEGNRLVFEPRLAQQADLLDGGFQPATHVRVELAGFPVPSGLRSRDGEVLETGFVSGFDTVAADSVVFLDGSPDAAYRLFLEGTSIGAFEPLRLTCAEPLDPRSLHPEAFLLRRYRADGSFDEIALDLRLSRNDMQSGARIELRAVESVGGGAPRRLEPGDYHLWIHEGEQAPRDLGGHPVLSSWASTQLPAVIAVELKPELEGNRHFREEFLTRALASPAEVPGVDGGALWDGSGVVALRLPRSAGDGSAGDVLLVQDGGLTAVRAARQDLHAARLGLEVGEQLDLSDLEGLVALRSQTSVRLAGRLERFSERGELKRGAGEPWSTWYGRVGSGGALPGLARAKLGSLDDWLAAQRSSGRNVTVIVAGGDLWIEGDVAVDGALILAAGGRLRVTGRIEAREVWVVGLGGGADVHPAARLSGLSFAPSGSNRLALPLRVGTLSAPFRPGGSSPRWRSALVGSTPGSGQIRIRFLGERELAGGRIKTIGPVDDASLLDRCEGIRVWIELEIQPGAAWDPPMVDFVELRWTEENDT